MKLTAIHAIERGEEATPSRVPPGGVWNATEQEHTDLIAMRAARLPTDAELAAFDAKAKGATVAVTTGPSSRELLEARATELKVKFQGNTSDTTLAERVAEAEAKVKADADAAAAKAAADDAKDGETLI